MSTSKTIKTGAWLLVPLTFLYVSIPLAELTYSNYLFGLFTLGFVAMGEYFFWDGKRSLESWCFLVMTLTCGVSVTFELDHIWDVFTTGFMCHLCGVYWVLCRSGKLYLGETSHLFLLDGINGFFLTPFGNYGLFFKTLFTRARRDEEKKSFDLGIVLGTIFAGMIGVILLIMAMRLLISADGNFEALLKLPELEWLHVDSVLLIKLLFTMVIAPYLFGLYAGCLLKPEEKLRESAHGMEAMLLGFKKLPARLWLIFITLFSILYVMFFLLQGSYMFSAFQMILPENYTFAEYARRGLAEMVGVTFINFMLLWLTTRTATDAGKVRTAGIILTIETIVFALIASLKIGMYIQAYGFTPLRVQSIWLCLVLLFTCGCILYHFFTKKNPVKFWFILSSFSFVILTVL